MRVQLRAADPGANTAPYLCGQVVDVVEVWTTAVTSLQGGKSWRAVPEAIRSIDVIFLRDLRSTCAFE
jgi:hypothetical protein